MVKKEKERKRQENRSKFRDYFASILFQCYSNEAIRINNRSTITFKLFVVICCMPIYLP